MTYADVVRAVKDGARVAAGFALAAVLVAFWLVQSDESTDAHPSDRRGR